MTLINRDRVYEAVNQAYCFAHQMSAQEIVGKTVLEGETEALSKDPRVQAAYLGG